MKTEAIKGGETERSSGDRTRKGGLFFGWKDAAALLRAGVTGGEGPRNDN